MGRHPVTWLDVFTDTPLQGNGLAVVHDADGVPDATMHAFARETGLSETTFVQAAGAPGADYANRIWTVSEEVPFAGHPSLGTAVAVALERGDTDVTYVQQTRVGTQPVTVRRDGDRAHASVLQEPATFGPEVDPVAVMRAAGLQPQDAHPALPPQLVSTGLPALVAPLADATALARVRFDRAAAARLLPEAFNLYLVAPDGPAGVRARMFPSEVAEDEDPATGSAAGALTAYLHARDGREELTVAQGLELGRPSRLECRYEDGRARVGGGVVVVVTGTVRLP